MDEYESLSHTTWDCKYHVVFIPKCRRKTLIIKSCVGIWAKCSAGLRFKRNQRSRKGI